MFRPHFLRNLHTLTMVLIIAGAVSAMAALWWANRTGLPESWRTAIENEMGKHGANVQIGGLSYVPFRGVIARDLRVFTDPGKKSELSRLEQVILDFDKTKLARGEIRLNRVELSDARLSLPVDPKNPASEVLQVSGVYATILMPAGRMLEIREARGRVAGIDVTAGARILGYKQDGGDQKEDPNEGKRRELFARILRELEGWKLDGGGAPKVRIFVEGDVDERSSVVATLSVEASGVGKNGHLLDRVSIEGTMTGDLLTLTKFRAEDSRGTFEGHVDYDLDSREGRFDASSSIEIPRLMDAWFGLEPPGAIAIGGRQSLEAEGGFQLDEANRPEIHATGRVGCRSVTLRGVPFDSVETAFSWKDQNIFLRDLRLKRKDGEAVGKALVEWPHVRIAVKSTLPVAIYRPFFVGQPLEKVLLDFGARTGEKVDVSLEGGFDLTDKFAWAYTGGGRVENVTYKGVPVDSAECGFSLSHHELDFFKGTVVFNYDDYPLRKAFDGPRQGTAKVGRIRYDGPSKIVEVEEVEGTFWAAPMVRLFAPKIAEPIELYRFHRPPALKASGVVDVTPQGRTALKIDFDSEQPADYRFLGENLTLRGPSGHVSFRGDKLTVENLKFSTFGGPVEARFTHQAGNLEGDVSWTRLSMPELTAVYGFEMKDGGLVTGRLDFNLKGNKIETMEGKGLIALEKAELFSVPMFGPLTPLVAGVLGNSRAGSQRAKDAFLSYRINEGILSSNDFQTATSSLTFTGDGSVSLIDRTLDMTIRMNARGFLGLITLPLRPFYGLFQFRGTGPLKDPKWVNVGFTAPPEKQNDALLAPPRAKVVTQE